jgi:hypothetical protein
MLLHIVLGLKPNLRGGERAGLWEESGEKAPHRCLAAEAADGWGGSGGRAALVGGENAARRVALGVLVGRGSLRGCGRELPEREPLIATIFYEIWGPKF